MDKFVVRLKTDEDWNYVVLKAKDTLVVVDAYVSWAGPCHALHRNLAELYYELGAELALRFVQAESDSIGALKGLEGTSRPTFLLWLNGKEVAQVQGALAPELTQAIRKHAPARTSQAGGL